MTKSTGDNENGGQRPEKIDPRKAKREENQRQKEQRRANRAEGTPQQSLQRTQPSSPPRTDAEPRSATLAVPLPSDPDGRVGIRFSALDTWFFRESRPHNAVGAAELASQFPPPARTLVGALRTSIGEQVNVDWADYKRHGDAHPLARILGHGDDLAPLQVDGPWPVLDGERLYSAPAFLLRRAPTAGQGLRRLIVGAPVETDLGRVRLPAMPEGERGAKPLSEHWLTAAGMAAALAGGLPALASVKCAEDLFDWEPRLGIARDNRRRTVEEHMLYQTRHLRPHPGLAVELGVRGLDPVHRPATGAVQRLGGEGRLAAIETIANSDPLDALRVAQPPADAHGLVLVLLTPADLDRNWLPPGFTEDDRSGARSWRGRIADLPLRIHAGVIGKAQREGGWDLMAGAPRPVRSLIPAGSAWYCTVEDGDIANALTHLHGSRIGHEDTHRLGRGLLAAGIWPKHDALD
jgi:CRISPR-associated protein Cmr3